MSSIKKVTQLAWASPVTLIGFLYVSLFWAMGWYEYVGRRGDALVWFVRVEKCPNVLKERWKNWAGQAIGNIVVVKYDLGTERGAITLRHEQEHVNQCMVLGPFMPILYGLFYVTIWVTCRHSDAYYSHPFELDARRAAGQVVDVEGLIEKMKDPDAKALANLATEIQFVHAYT